MDSPLHKPFERTEPVTAVQEIEAPAAGEQTSAQAECRVEDLSLSSVVARTLVQVREAQRKWSHRSVAERVRIIGRVAAMLAEQAQPLAELVMRPAASPGEILASEILPLAEACRYVARYGGRALASRTLPQTDRAWWMGSIRVLETREPFGVVLIIGPANYPLLLPGVQILQALAAGNGVLIKPAPECAGALERFVQLCTQAGVPHGLAALLPTSAEAAVEAMRAGVDKVVFTGSLETGRRVAQQLAETMTPAALELSGNDAVFVLEDADLERVAKSIVYALDLNGGQSCISPRRLFATEPTIERLLPRLVRAVEACQPRSIQPHGFAHARAAVDQALAEGASIVAGDLTTFSSATRVSPLVLAGVSTSMRVAGDDLFAPVLAVIEVRDMASALEQSSRCRYALGASVFGSAESAARYAQQISVGCVTVNDVLVPTADPRVSFGGWNASGYGVTRGMEGLRELTRLKVTCERRGRWLPHLSTDASQLAMLMRGVLAMRHGRALGDRWRGLKLLMKAFRK